MSHEIETHGTQAAALFARQDVWHRLGTTLAGGGAFTASRSAARPASLSGTAHTASSFVGFGLQGGVVDGDQPLLWAGEDCDVGPRCHRRRASGRGGILTTVLGGGCCSVSLAMVVLSRPWITGRGYGRAAPGTGSPVSPAPPASDRSCEAGWQDVSVSRSRKGVPNRAATRKRPEARVVSGKGTEVIESVPADGTLLSAVTGSLLEAIAGARSPLEAELVLCGVFGTLEQGLDDDADDQERAQALIVLLGQVITDAQRLATAEASGLLRVCAVLGPVQTRAAAGEAAGGLAAAGVPERSWAPRVGHPMMLRAWRYGDVFGAQSSIGVLFDYQGREHVVMVLVDHLLGGGVKDCWVAQGRAAKGMRNQVAAAMAANPTTFFEDLDAATAAEHLRSALANPPCPEQDDQVQDVAANLYLVRARTDLLARLAGLPPQ